MIGFLGGNSSNTTRNNTCKPKLYPLVSKAEEKIDRVRPRSIGVREKRRRDLWDFGSFDEKIHVLTIPSVHEIGYKKSEKIPHTEMMTHFSPKVEDRKRIARKEDKKEFQELAGVLVGKTVTSGKISETTSIKNSFSLACNEKMPRRRTKARTKNKQVKAPFYEVPNRGYGLGPEL